MTVRLRAYAKINLGLLILGKRPDGYHDIATVFQQINLFDTLHFRKETQGFGIEASGLPIPLDENNLIYQAFYRMKQTYGFEGGMYVHIDKRIPIGGGLGGGSSDAAATLLAINTLFGLGLVPETLIETGMHIGSDVPFFLQGGTALGLGRGERLEPLSLPTNYWLVLLFPGFSVSTAWAYGQVRMALTRERKLTTFRSLFKKFDRYALRGHLVNELESVVFERHPQLHHLKMQLEEEGAFYASMSGSGSTLFGMFESQEKAEGAQAFFLRRGVHAQMARPIVHPPHIEEIKTGPFAD